MYHERMGILPLKKRINHDKCNFATKQRMFGVFAIDEILRYQWSPFAASRTFFHPAHSCCTKKNQRATMHPATFVSGIWASKDKTFAVAVVCKKWRSSFCVWDLILLCSTSDCQLIMRLAQDVGRVGMQLLPSIFCKGLKNRALGIHYSDGIQLWCQKGRFRKSPSI